MTESMTAVEFVEMVDRFLKHPVFTEQEAMIVAALYENKINKQTAGKLLIKVAEHNIAKINELFSMDANQLQKLIEEVE